MTIMIDWMQQRWQQLYDWVMRLLHPAPLPMPEEPASRAEERAQLLDRLSALRARHAQDTAARHAEMATLTQELALVETHANRLRRALAELEQEQFHASLQTGIEEDRVRADLTEKISTTLELFLNELTRELEQWRHTESFSTPEMKRDYTLVKKHLVIHSNGPSIQRRVRALVAAQARARELQYEPLTISQLIDELAQLRSSLPQVETEEIAGHRAAVLAHA